MSAGARRRVALTLSLLAGALIAPATALGHVSVVPRSAQAGAYAVFDVRVPNERSDASTVRIDVQLPPGLVAVAYEPQPAWTTRVIRERLAQPIETPNGPISEQVARIVWRGDGSPAGSIPPGAFRDFPISLQVPDEPGATLAFKALQTYSDGEVVRWIGSPEADLPAALVAVTAAGGEGDGAGAGHGGAADSSDGAPDAGVERGAAADGSGGPSAAADGGSDDGRGGASTALAIAGLVAGVAGLLVGGAALLVARGRARAREASAA